MRIAHLSAEVSPFAKTGGLGDVVGALPIAQKELGDDVAVYMPLYRQVREWAGKKGVQLEWVMDPFTVDVGFHRHEVGVLKLHLPGTTVPVFTIAADTFFNRPHLYATNLHGHDDGLTRYAVFVRAAMEVMRRLKYVPEVLHCHDWHTALAPMAVAWDAPRDWHFEKAVTLLTIHNLAYQGLYGMERFVDLNLPRGAEPALEWKGALNLMKGGVLAADAVTAVSPTFAWEIRTPDGGFGLDPLLRHRGWDVHGILNGIDTRVWDPANDKLLAGSYDAQNLGGKRECRKALLRHAGMDPEEKGLVVGIVGRLTAQKGYDLLFPALHQLMADGVRFVFLGSGEDDLEREVRHFSSFARGRFWGHVGFSDDLAHQIYAGSDAFLMPSRFEPCGLGQLYALRYGSVPIVRKTGGLADTVVGFHGHNRDEATGFTFDEPSPWALRETVRWANRCYKDSGLWTQLVRNGMGRDFSWTRSAQHYRGLYEHLLKRKQG